MLLIILLAYERWYIVGINLPCRVARRRVGLCVTVLCKHVLIQGTGVVSAETPLGCNEAFGFLFEASDVRSKP